MDEVRIEKDGDDGEKRRRENAKLGCAVIAFGVGFLVVVVIATPFVVMLYKAAFGG